MRIEKTGKTGAPYAALQKKGMGFSFSNDGFKEGIEKPSARVFLDLSKPSGSWYNRIGCYADCINIFDERDNRLRRFNLMMGFAKEKPKM